MRVVQRCTWMLLSLGLVLPFAVPGRAQTPVPKLNKVIIEPGDGDSIAQLKQTGIARVDNYGSYWIVEATDEQADALKKTFGDRVTRANYLNRIELQSMTLDTTASEPVVPQALRQSAPKGTRLRLIQFKAPVQPEWLDQVKADGQVKIVSYIPNNAYVVFLDQQAEDNLGKLMAPSGPIQWVGPYHPYYKMDSMLSSVPSLSIDVGVGVVNSPDAEQTLQAIGRFASEPPGKASTLPSQIIIKIKVNPSNLASIAQMPDVLWIQRNAPMRPHDEQQMLISADRISQLPGHTPVPGVDDYLDFLTNVVGFSTDPAEYPIMDDADTLANATMLFNDFFELGSPTNLTRLAGFLRMCPPSAILCENFHGPFVMSVMAAYNSSKTDPVNLDANGFRKGIGVSPFGRISNTILYNLSGANCVFCVPNPNHASLMDIPLNEYQVLGARISNNSWGQIPVAGTGGNLGIYDGDSLAYDITVRDALASGVQFTLATNTIGSNVVVVTVVTNTPGGLFPLNQEMITVFSAGNLQALGTAQGGFGDIITTPPATAKNIISVGASENARPAAEAFNQCFLFPDQDDNSFDISVFSSFGPAIDGRFKPEIVAPGAAIFGVFGLATNSFVTNIVVGTNVFLVPTTGNAYVCGSGTSFSAPVVSGAAQLLWWYFQHRLVNEQGQNLLQPSPAMAKAYMCNAARYLPITNPQTGVQDTLPSIAQGMGEIDLSRMFDGVPRLIRDETTPRAIDNTLLTTNPIPHQTFFSRSGQSYEVSGTIADSTQPFRATLAWTDAPGNPGAFKQLVNDLDLQVTVGGQTYKGNIFVGPNSVPGGSFDDLNNMESVFLPGGQTGTWSVVVRAVNIAGHGVPNVQSGVNQDFALVVYNSGASSLPSDVPNLSTNNSCQTALPITRFPFSFTNSLTKTVYRNVHPSPSAGRGGIDEFFVINEPTASTQFTVDTTGSSFDNLLSVWRVRVFPQTVFVTGPCGALIELVSSGSSTNGLGSQVGFTADGSNTYFIVVEPHNNGAGGTMVLNVRETGVLASFNPTSLAFGSQAIGTTSAVQSVSYSSVAPVAINIANVAVTGANASDFMVQSDGCAGNSILPGTNCTISVIFSPIATGPRNAVLVVTDDATGSPRFVPLTGFGLPPSPIICLNSSGLSFGGLSVGSTSAVQQVTINNCGSAALFITNLVLSGVASNDYIISANTCGGTIAPGGTCSFNVRFSPTAGGLRPASLTINNNTSSGPSVIALNGTGKSGLPDLWIGKTLNVKSFLGKNLLTPPNPIRIQTLSQNGARGKKRVFYVAFQNIGDATDSFRVQGSGSVPNIVSIRYFLGGIPSESVEVTDAVTNGTYVSASMAPGAFTGPETMLRVEVTPAKNAAAGTNIVSITATSLVSPSKTDSIQFAVIHR